MLDMRTLLFLAGIISLINCIAMLYIYLTRKTYPGFFQWLLGTFLYFLGSLLISFRGFIHDFFSVIIANLFIISNISLLLYGLLVFTKTRGHAKIHALTLASASMIIAYFLLITPDINARIITVSLFISILFILCAWAAFRRIPAILGEKNILLISLFCIMALWHLLRVVITSIQYKNISGIMDAGSIHTLTMFVSICGSIFVNLGLIILNSQRIEKDLTAARDEIHHLKGFLAICSHCKKIRDDQGYWNQLEEYISQHADVAFSHGICPECTEKFYNDFSSMDERKKKHHDSAD